MGELKRYILLARKGFLTDALSELDPGRGLTESPTPFVIKSKIAGGRDIRVIHSVTANGPKLVELDDLAAEAVERNPDVQKAPVFKYAKPLTRGILEASFPLIAPDVGHPLKGRPNVSITVKEIKSGRWVPAGGGLVVTAISDLANKIGDKTSTDDFGKANLWVSGNKIERLCCERRWTWGGYSEGVTADLSIDLKLEPLSKDFTDCVRKYYPQSRFNPTIGVTVGVIDTGVSPHDHDDLNVIGGRNVVEGEPDDDYQDVGPHGTFVAGIIGSTGKRFPKLRGLAPGVRIRSYRVFGGGLATGGETFPLIRAMYYAELDKCDILNLSIENFEEGPGKKDDGLQMAITRARDHGMLVVVAAGNDGREDIDYPAAYDGTTAVSAMGCKGTFPKGAMENMIISERLAAKHPDEFIASFSNVGTHISVTALGVGVLSTLPRNRFGSCSGTSMAAPVVTGAAASLLSQRPDIYNLPPNRDRSNAIEQLLFDSCVTRGFSRTFEGRGMPDPAKV